MQSQIVQDKQQAPKTSWKLKVTFNQDAIDRVADLLGMALGHIIKKMSLLDVAALINVLEHNKWDHDNDRTLVVEFGNSFDKRFFLDTMLHAFEKIEVVE